MPAQKPGTRDKYFTSTIALPQQTLWRIYRALKEDDIDLFSEKGILDASLIPILGILDDHKHDVMPDYMFGDKWYNQLLGSIATDPLAFMSRGLTAGAQIARSANSLRRIKT